MILSLQYFSRAKFTSAKVVRDVTRVRVRGLLFTFSIFLVADPVVKKNDYKTICCAMPSIKYISFTFTKYRN